MKRSMLIHPTLVLWLQYPQTYGWPKLHNCRVERVTASGGEVGRINIAGGAGVRCFHFCIFVSYQVDHSNPPVWQTYCIHVSEQMLIWRTFWIDFSLSAIIIQIGPLRCWPGGLCLSRSIGDTDVGEFIVPVPHVKQVKVHNPYKLLYECSGGNYYFILLDSSWHQS